MSIDLLERGAAALGLLVEQVAFVGGATIVLWITDPGAPAPWPRRTSTWSSRSRRAASRFHALRLLLPEAAEAGCVAPHPSD
jgi:hypothetical protein